VEREREGERERDFESLKMDRPKERDLRGLR
jgi:hypothetical protein